MPATLLAVDTSTQRCGVALIVDGRVRAALSLDHPDTHSRYLLDAIDGILALNRMAPADIDAFAVTRGPGSFTGLRIGISTVKGLAFAGDKPVVGVSSLEVLAHQAAGDASRVCAMLDARRHEIYWSIYQRRDGLLQPESDEQVGPVARLIDNIHGHIHGHIDGPCTVIGNAAVLYAAQLSKACGQAVRWAPAICHEIDPATVVQLAWQRFQQGRVDDAQSVVPVYLRKSDAEMHRAP